MALAINCFNRGRISKLALARTDFTRTQFSAEVQTNWMPRALGSMMLRPGTRYTGNTRDNLYSVSIPFVFAVSDTARLEMTDSAMRVWVNDALISRPAVTTAIANGNFTVNLASWTDEDAGGSVSSWVAPGYMSLVGTGNSEARRRQQVVVTGGDLGTRHALDITVARGPVKLRVGSTAGGDEYITETTLETGAHSLAFTPIGDFYVDLFNYNEYAGLVDSVNIAAAGTMVIAAPWAEADLPDLRWDQSGDVVFVACDGYRQRRIERRATDSWSIVLYESDDGPFRIQNVGPITIAPGATSGDTTLTASEDLFKPTQIGALYRLTHTGQLQDADLDGADQFCDPIRVTGVDGTRSFAIIITGTWTGTLTLQYSVSEPGDWVDAPAGGGSGTMTFTANASIAYDDTLDNQVIYYRIGFKSGDYGSGTASVTLSSSSGSQTGIARITGYTSSTVVDAQVLEEFGSPTATADWSESYWSEYRGFPSADQFYEGRLWWGGQDRNWGSITDSFSSYDDEFEGDAGPISRSIGSGPVNQVFWMAGLNRLLLGTGGAVFAVRSSSLDEPVTPTNYNIKAIDTPGDGAANVRSVKSGTSVFYVQQSGQRVYEAAVGENGYDYQASDLTVHVPEMGEPSIVAMAVQHQPEKRLHCVRSDGTVAIMVYDKAEDVKCWIDFETDGRVEDVCVLPGQVEDQVYYTILRTINGAEVRFHEKWALESECVGGTLNLQADCFLVGSGSIVSLSHLEGQEVVLWADGEDRGTFTVSGGAIPGSYGSWVAGLPYEATYKSVKLAYAVNAGTGLTAKKRVFQMGLIARDIHPRGLEYGPDFDTLDPLPEVLHGEIIDPDTVIEAYDDDMFSFDGSWESDARLCLKASAPRPCTVLAVTYTVETNQN